MASPLVDDSTGVLGTSELTQTKIATDVSDYLARMTMERWNKAVMWRASARCGSSTLKNVMYNCYNQRYGILSPEDIKLLDALQIRKDYYVNLSALKTTTVVAWMRDLIMNSNELPFTISPTPIPELSEFARLEVLQQVKRQIFMQGFSGDVLQLVKDLKYKQIDAENKYARDAADAMQLLIRDQCLEGGFEIALMRFINDFVMYPYAVLHGPVPVRKTVMEWSGNRLVKKEKVVMSFIPVSAWDFLWTPDSPDAHTGAGVFIRERMSKAQMKKALDNKAYIRQNVARVLDMGIRGTAPVNWVSEGGPNANNKGWGDDDTVDIIKHYGKVSGRELSKYGITGVSDTDYYDAVIEVACGLSIRIYISPTNNLDIRPVSTASFEEVSGSIAGESLCQKIRGVELLYLDTIRYLSVNMAYAAGPIAEMDYGRVAPYMNAEDIGRLVPLTAYPVAPDTTNRGVPAFRFEKVPENIVAYTRCGEYFMSLADKVTNIPAALHAEPIGSGANRTFRGISLLQGNAMKPLQSAIANMDKYVFRQVGTVMYTYNMIFSKDPSVKGDAKVDARGASGLVQKEIDRQNSLDVMQLVAQIPPGYVPPNTVRWAINTALANVGVPTDKLDSEDESANNMTLQSQSQTPEPVQGGAPPEAIAEGSI